MKLVIFDLDDTLIDFASTREVAYARLSAYLASQGIDPVPFIAGCRRVDRPIFAQFERGEISRREYRLRRFSEPLAMMGLQPQADMVEHLNHVFMVCVNDEPLLFDDARPTLSALRAAGVATAILTNGPSDGQRRKLAATGLTDAVDHVAIGEEIGFSKPRPEAYRAIVSRFGFDPADAVMVGDSPELDYDGARQAGLQAWLLDRQARHADSPRAVIGSLAQVPPRLQLAG